MGTTWVVIKDYLGNYIVSRIYNLEASSPLVAEVMTLRNGILLAIEHNMKTYIYRG